MPQPRIKLTCIVNRSLAYYFREALVDSMKSNPYSIVIDGSNGLGLEKINPIALKMFDASQGPRFLEICITTGMYYYSI